MNNGAYVIPGRTTLAEWIRESWLPMTEPRVKSTTFHSYRQNLELHVLPTLGQKRLQQLTPPMLTGLYARLAQDRDERKGLSAKTISYIHSTLHKALSDAVDSSLLFKKVAATAKPPRPNRRATSGIQAWEPDQLASFLHAVGGTRLEAMWRLSAMTGMRRDEVLGLRWCDLDLGRARLSVRQSARRRWLRRRPHDAEEPQRPGDRSRRRDCQAARGAPPAPGRGAAEWGIDYQDYDLVVAKENGEPIHPHTFSQAFEQLIAKAGLRAIRLHNLRHTHGTLALKAGVPVKVISERLGHESPAFTLKQYAHVIPGMQAEAAAQVAAMIDDSPRPFDNRTWPENDESPGLPGLFLCFNFQAFLELSE